MSPGCRRRAHRQRQQRRRQRSIPARPNGPRPCPSYPATTPPPQLLLGMSGLGPHFYFVKSQPRARHVWLGSSGQVITSFHFAKSKPRVLIVTKKNCVVHVKNIFLRLYFYYICSFFCLLLSL